MNFSLSPKDFSTYLEHHLDRSFPDGRSNKEIEKCFSLALPKIEYCMKHIKLPHFQINGEAHLNHLNSDQMAMVIGTLANTAFFQMNNLELASKLFYLNKILHGFNCMYDTKLPDVFLVIHAIGTILGKADYNDFFVVCHGCTVGSNNGKAPRFGKGVVMYPHSAIIGDSQIGDNVVLSYGATVLDASVLNDRIVVSESNFSLKEKKSQNRMNYYFNGFN